MNFWVYFFTIVYFLSVQAQNVEDANLNFTEILKKYGYPVEIHEIETEDGYLLDVYRIPYGRKSRTHEANKYPAILNHGLLGSAENFILMGPKKSLAYMLADHGYDVWLCNARGTMHSRKHRTLNPDKDAAFWQFSWHEIGVYDLPATIDYVLNATHTDKVHFIGHSQGCTTFFVMCSERPEYNDRIKIMIAMAPSAILVNMKDPFVKMITPFYSFLERLSENLNERELIPFISNTRLRGLMKELCYDNRLMYSICRVIFLLVTQDSEMDMNVFDFFMSTVPAGASVKQALHYAQIVESGKFRKYDWGPAENKRRYHSDTPPEYKMKNITAPMVLIYGETDELVSKEDVAIIAKVLPNVVEMYKVPSKIWTHLDYLWAKNVKVLLYNKILEIMKKYN